MNKVLKFYKKNGNNKYTGYDLRTYDSSVYQRLLDGVSKRNKNDMEHSMNWIGEKKSRLSRIKALSTKGVFIMNMNKDGTAISVVPLWNDFFYRRRK